MERARVVQIDKESGCSICLLDDSNRLTELPWKQLHLSAITSTLFPHLRKHLPDYIKVNDVFLLDAQMTERGVEYTFNFMKPFDDGAKDQHALVVKVLKTACVAVAGGDTPAWVRMSAFSMEEDCSDLRTILSRGSRLLLSGMAKLRPKKFLNEERVGIQWQASQACITNVLDAELVEEPAEVEEMESEDILLPEIEECMDTEEVEEEDVYTDIGVIGAHTDKKGLLFSQQYGFVRFDLGTCKINGLEADNFNALVHCGQNVHFQSKRLLPYEDGTLSEYTAVNVRTRDVGQPDRYIYEGKVVAISSVIFKGFNDHTTLGMMLDEFSGRRIHFAPDDHPDWVVAHLRVGSGQAVVAGLDLRGVWWVLCFVELQREYEKMVRTALCATQIPRILSIWGLSFQAVIEGLGILGSVSLRSATLWSPNFGRVRIPMESCRFLGVEWYTGRSFVVDKFHSGQVCQFMAQREPDGSYLATLLRPVDRDVRDIASIMMGINFDIKLAMVSEFHKTHGYLNRGEVIFHLEDYVGYVRDLTSVLGLKKGQKVAVAVTKCDPVGPYGSKWRVLSFMDRQWQFEHFQRTSRGLPLASLADGWQDFPKLAGVGIVASMKLSGEAMTIYCPRYDILMSCTYSASVAKSPACLLLGNYTTAQYVYFEAQPRKKPKHEKHVTKVMPYFGDPPFEPQDCGLHLVDGTVLREDTDDVKKGVKNVCILSSHLGNVWFAAEDLPTKDWPGFRTGQVMKLLINKDSSMDAQWFDCQYRAIALVELQGHLEAKIRGGVLKQSHTLLDDLATRSQPERLVPQCDTWSVAAGGRDFNRALCAAAMRPDNRLMAFSNQARGAFSRARQAPISRVVTGELRVPRCDETWGELASSSAQNVENRLPTFGERLENVSEDVESGSPMEY